MAKKVYVGASEEYALLEYIESTGTQYIDTGIMANTISGATVDFQLTSVGTTEVEVLAAYAGNASRIQCGWAGSVFMTAGGFGYSQVADATARTVGTSTGPVGSPALSVYLFGQHEGTTVKWLSSAKLYSCSVSVGGELFRQFVPAKRRSDGAAGLYDTVAGGFYVNGGTGAFIPGPETGEVISVPPVARSVKEIYVGVAERYKRLEYIASTGTQYIDTGLVASTISGATVDFQFTQKPATGKEMNIIGSFQDANNSFLCGYANYSTFTGFLLGYGFTYSQTADPTARTVGTSTGPVGAPPYTAYLFAHHGINGDVYHYSSAKLYSCQFSVGGEPVRDFVPVQRLSDGVVGLYDTVEGKLYVNDGTGAFEAGSETGEVISVPPVARKIKKGYVGVDGVARKFWDPIRLISGSHNNRTGATITIDMDGEYPYIAVQGGSGTGWCGAMLGVGEKTALIPAGTPVTFQVEASRNVQYSDYLIGFYDEDGAVIRRWVNSNPGMTTYVPNKDFYVTFDVQIGGLNSTSLSCTMTIISLTVGTEKIV